MMKSHGSLRANGFGIPYACSLINTLHRWKTSCLTGVPWFTWAMALGSGRSRRPLASESCPGLVATLPDIIHLGRARRGIEKWLLWQ